MQDMTSAPAPADPAAMMSDPAVKEALIQGGYWDVAVESLRQEGGGTPSEEQILERAMMIAQAEQQEAPEQRQEPPAAEAMEEVPTSLPPPTMQEAPTGQPAYNSLWGATGYARR